MKNSGNTKKSTKKTQSPVNGNFCGRTRREFLHTLGGGFTSLALTGLLSWDGFLNNQAVAADGIDQYSNPLHPYCRNAETQ